MDAFIVVFCFTIFICTWLVLFMILFCCFYSIINMFWVVVLDFVASKFLDGFWFFLGILFVLLLIFRLFVLIYFGCIGFVCFDLCKVFGYQWYWMYFIGQSKSIVSNIFLESDYMIGDIRMLQCTQLITLWSLCMYKFWLSSVDVIHSFTVVSLGIKCDCIPGRCNEIVLISLCSGVFYGQCSELCGVLHGFMPIGIHFV